MTKEVRNGLSVLTADEGKYLHNGDTYTDSVFLGIYDSPDNWVEVDEIPDEPEQTDEEITAEEALAIITGGAV